MIDLSGEILRLRNKGLSQRAIATALNISRKRVRTALKRLEPAVTEIVQSSTPSGISIESPKGRIKTLDGLIAAAEVDLDRWEIERHVINKWEVGAKNDDGDIQIEELWQVKVWFRPRRDMAQFAAIKADVLADIAKHAPRYGKRPTIHFKSHRHMLEIGLFDFHLGKLAWGEETGADWDLGIAERVFKWAIADLIRKAQGYPVDKVVFPIGQDFFHADNLANTTTKGTPLDVDTRWLKMFRKGRELTVWAIDELLKIAPVEVPVVPGNHDEQSTLNLGEVLCAWYRNCADVQIQNSPRGRKYVKYGVNLIGFAHGDGERLADLPAIMSSEAAGMWGDGQLREMHVGHFHQKRKIESLREYNGVIVRILPSLCASDAWHYRNGFVGNQRTAEAYLWSYDSGLSAMICANLIGDLEKDGNL